MKAVSAASGKIGRSSSRDFMIRWAGPSRWREDGQPAVYSCWPEQTGESAWWVASKKSQIARAMV
jgi:hypothetical protein